MNPWPIIRARLRAERAGGQSSCGRIWESVPAAFPVTDPETFTDLHRAVFCRLVEVGDCLERGDEEAARKAMAMAAEIEAELWSGGAEVPPVSD